MSFGVDGLAMFLGPFCSLNALAAYTTKRTPFRKNTGAKATRYHSVYEV